MPTQAKPFGAVFLLVTVGLYQCLHVRLDTCPSIHTPCFQTSSYFDTTECSSYTRVGGGAMTDPERIALQ